MNIIDKMGRKPDSVTELDNGDIVYAYGLNRYRYAVDGVYVSTESSGEIVSDGLECRLNPDDSIEMFEFANGWSWLAIPGDEPLYELGRELTQVGGDLTPSGRPEQKQGMSLWFEIPKVWVQFKMDGDLIQMDDCWSGDEYWSQTVEGALERLQWLIERTADDDLWDAIAEGRKVMEERNQMLNGLVAETEEDEDDENAN
jgi:hypothetical protein